MSSLLVNFDPLASHLHGILHRVFVSLYNAFSHDLYSRFNFFVCRSERENVDEDILAMGTGAHKVTFCYKSLLQSLRDNICRLRLISCNLLTSIRNRFDAAFCHLCILFVSPYPLHPLPPQNAGRAQHSSQPHRTLGGQSSPCCAVAHISGAVMSHFIFIPVLNALSGCAVCSWWYSQGCGWI